MVSVESYKHKFAKQVLAEWLLNPPPCWTSFGDGDVLLEYPIIDNPDICNGLDATWKRVPTYEELKVAGTPPSVIVDVVKTHNGHIQSAFEVVHKHPVTPEKLRRLQALTAAAPVPFDVWTVSADWVLGQVGVPTGFVGECIVRAHVDKWRDDMIAGLKRLYVTSESQQDVVRYAVAAKVVARGATFADVLSVLRFSPYEDHARMIAERVREASQPTTVPKFLIRNEPVPPPAPPPPPPPVLKPPPPVFSNVRGEASQNDLMALMMHDAAKADKMVQWLIKHRVLLRNTTVFEAFSVLLFTRDVDWPVHATFEDLVSFLAA